MSRKIFRTISAGSMVERPRSTSRTELKWNVRPEAMDETMDDDAKDPGIFQRRSASGAKPEDAVTGSMDEKMDCEITTTTTLDPHSGVPRPTNLDQLNRKQRINWKQTKRG